MRYLALLLFVAGCGPAVKMDGHVPDTPPAPVFDDHIAAEVVADLAALDNSPQKDSQPIKGMLSKAHQFGIPKSFVDKVYDAVPDLRRSEAFDFSNDQISRVRAIK